MQLTILIADDDDSIREMLREVLEDAGYKTLVARNGRAAVALTREHKPDLALLDVSMPELDGLNACRMIKEDARTAHIPVFLVTAQSDTRSKIKGLNAGATDYITKPFDMNELLARLRGTLAEKSRHDQLSAQALTDSLTSLTNRRGLEQQLDQLLAYVQRHDEPLSVLMVDVDHFKAVNDTFGHDVGDIVLSALAHRALESVRSQDVVGRFGGEEFLIILPGAAYGAAIAAAERLRAHVANSGIAAPGELLDMTISVGVATVQPDEHIERNALIALADAALYTAKRTGRNRVVHAAGQQTLPLGQPDAPESARVLLAVLDLVDPALAAHARRVANACWNIGGVMRVAPTERARICWAGLLHDIGHLALGPQAPGERAIHLTDAYSLGKMREAAVNLLTQVPALAPLTPIIVAQHEHWDGSGQPHGLRGRTIPLGARIIAVAESFDILRYESPLVVASPSAKIDAQAGTRLDPEVVRAASYSFA